MVNMLFQPPNDQHIIEETKIYTARHWKPSHAAKYRVGENITASTEYAASTRFAELTILRVVEWDGQRDGNASEVMGLSLQTIGMYEGYDGWHEFYKAYQSLNAHNWNDEDRKHYFIEFALHRRIWSESPDIDELMDRLKYEGKDGEWYALRYEIQEDASPVEHIHVEYEMIEQRDEFGEDCVYAISEFTVWTQDRVYVSDPDMETVNSVQRHPPATKEGHSHKRTVAICDTVVY